MANAKHTAPARRSRPPYRVVSQRNRANRANVALPFSVLRAEEPAKMRVGDWIGLAGLVTLVVGFAVAIRELIRIVGASEAAGSLAGQPVSPEQAGQARQENTPARRESVR